MLYVIIKLHNLGIVAYINDWWKSLLKKGHAGGNVWENTSCFSIERQYVTSDIYKKEKYTFLFFYWTYVVAAKSYSVLVIRKIKLVLRIVNDLFVHS